MTVSHYLVSWTQVIGLVVGLYGLFCLSINILGSGIVNVLRPILPATAFLLTAVGIANLPRLNNGSPPIPPLVPVLFALAFFGLGYALAFFAQLRKARSGRFPSLILPGTTASAVVVFLFVLLLVSANDPKVTDIARTRTLDVIVVMLLIFVLLNATSAVAYLSKERLEFIGFAASALAVLTQFVPSVLDILNIPVK